MWYFSSPMLVYGEDALSHLHHIQGSRALIVTDPTLARLGIAARIEDILKDVGFATCVFAEVEPEPSLQTVRRGAVVASEFQPDWIIGLGGGSPLDASKAIWALYERPDLDPTDINPMETLGLSKAKLIAIPTTSGTGSEATWALVLTDTEEKRKFSTGSRELVPTVAIVDPSLTMELPPRVTADTGLDALTHAIEGYTCAWANDFSDGLCLKAVQLVFDYLERAYAGGDDVEAREKMGNCRLASGSWLWQRQPGPGARHGTQLWLVVQAAARPLPSRSICPTSPSSPSTRVSAAMWTSCASSVGATAVTRRRPVACWWRRCASWNAPSASPCVLPTSA